MTRLRIFPLLLIVLCIAVAAPKIEVEATDVKLKREGDLILVDITLKNVSPKPIKGLTAVLKFYSPSHEVMSTQRIAIDEPVLEPGAESQIHAQLTAPPKTVSAELSTAGTGNKHVESSGNGPFTIDE